MVGVNNKTVNVNQFGYSKALFKETFGLNSTYYSFDQGDYHFVVLDPNNIDNKWNISGKGLEYFIDEPQMSWLKRDLSGTYGPVIVFMHEPTQNLKNPEKLREILRANNTLMIFSGRWHNDELLNASGIPEQTSGALSAAWWQGPHTDGSPEGYRAVVLNGTRISSFFKAAGSKEQINVIHQQDVSLQPERLKVDHRRDQRQKRCRLRPGVGRHNQGL